MSYEIIHGEALPDEVTNTLEDGQLAVGVRIPSSVRTPTNYLSELRKYKDLYNNIYQQMEVANKLYRYNSLVGNAVDVLLDFAITKVEPLPTGNKKLDAVLNHWFESLNEENTNGLPGMFSLMQEIGLEWFTSGNAFPYTKWNNVEINNGYYKLPSVINLINPQAIDIPLGPLAFGQEMICLKYDSDLVGMISSDGRGDREAALLKASMPRSLLNSLKNNTGFQTTRLNPKYVTHLKRRAKGYQAWGVPYLTRCFSSASLIERLRELEEAVTTGLINLITIFKIGSDEYPANPDRINKFASLIRNPKALSTLVWAHDVDMIQVGPEGKVLQYKDKFKDAKEDLLISLGLPPVLMSLNQTGDEWVSILSLVERLSNWRKIVSIWLERVCNQIVLNNKFDPKIKVKVKWDRMNLANDAEVKNLVLAFYDRGLISIKTALGESRYNVEHEIKNKAEEEPYKGEFLPPELPFTGGVGPQKGKPTDNNKDNKEATTKKSVTKTEKTVNLNKDEKRKIPGGKRKNDK